MSKKGKRNDVGMFDLVIELNKNSNAMLKLQALLYGLYNRHVTLLHL